MVPTLESLGIEKLSVEDRLVLVQRIWDSIADARPPLPLTEAQRAELDRRLEEHERNPQEGSSWEAVREATLRRLAK